MNLINQQPSDINNPEYEDALENIIQGYKKYQIVYTAIELGLFKYLEEKGRANKEDISQSLGIKGILTKSFLQVLTEMGLINQQERLYSNSEVAEKLFSLDDYSDRSEWVKHSGNQNPYWNNLKETVEINTNGKDRPLSKDFIDYLARRSLRSESQEIVQAVVAWDGFYQSKSILDIGGGHALNSRLNYIKSEKKPGMR